MCISVCVSDLLDHDGDILVQVAAVELHQIYENMEKVGGETYVHPQEDKACWERARTDKQILPVNEVCESPFMSLQVTITNITTKVTHISLNLNC